MNIPTKVLTMATSKMMRRMICAYLIKNNKNSWMVFCKTCNYTAPNFFCRTLASHSIPAIDMPSSNTTVMTPTILMSFSSSTMMALLSWMQCKIYHNYTHDQMFPVETFSTWSSAIMSNFYAPSAIQSQSLQIPPHTWRQPQHWQRQKSAQWSHQTQVLNFEISSSRLHLRWGIEQFHGWLITACFTQSFVVQWIWKAFVLPPRTTPLVQMADMERPVMVVTTQLRTMTTIPRPEKHTAGFL